jgi:hypothetical protein
MAAENGVYRGCFRRPFHRTPTREPRRFKLFLCSCANLMIPSAGCFPPGLQVNRGTCRFGRYKNSRRPHPPRRASRASPHPPQVSVAHPCLPTLTRRPPPPSARPIDSAYAGPFLAPGQRGRNGPGHFRGNNVEQQLLPLILTACRGHSGVNKNPFRAARAIICVSLRGVHLTDVHLIGIVYLTGKLRFPRATSRRVTSKWHSKGCC